MSALEILRDLKIKRRRAKELQEVVVEWGSSEYIKKIGVENMTRRELRNHLEARDLDTSGTRKELLERLNQSVQEEDLSAHAYTDTVDAEFLIERDLEERGSCYAVGRNGAGQLGLGDMEPRLVLTVIPHTRGANICQLIPAANMTFAMTEDHEVYVWGGGGVGPTGIPKNEAVMHIKSDTHLEPALVDDLSGEEIRGVAVGSSHAIAYSAGGDCFVWGANQAGQLGLGDLRGRDEVTVNDNFPQVHMVACGENHSCVVVEDDTMYSWGHAANGRLGLGTRERIGVDEKVRQYFPTPTQVGNLGRIEQVACGATHVVVLAEGGSVFSWGDGSGGKLGHGDNDERIVPTLVEEFDGKHVLQVACNTWHSAAIVVDPPLIEGGWVYTWGSGYHGQLGQEDITCSPIPRRVNGLADLHINVRFISCGSHHNAAITSDSELYTWGSNACKCLGRDVDEVDVEYTPTPGHVGGFGAIVDRVGRGMVRHVGCGREFTIVCTFPYDGPSVEVARKLEDERAILAEEERIRQAQLAEEEEDKRLLAEEEAELEALRQASIIKLCSLCEDCTGFEADDTRPTICKSCGHSTTYHTIASQSKYSAMQGNPENWGAGAVGNLLKQKNQATKVRVARGTV